MDRMERSTARAGFLLGVGDGWQRLLAGLQIGRPPKAQDDPHRSSSPSHCRRCHTVGNFVCAPAGQRSGPNKFMGQQLDRQSSGTSRGNPDQLLKPDGSPSCASQHRWQQGQAPVVERVRYQTRHDRRRQRRNGGRKFGYRLRKPASNYIRWFKVGHHSAGSPGLERSGGVERRSPFRRRREPVFACCHGPWGRFTRLGFRLPTFRRRAISRQVPNSRSWTGS